MTGVASYRLASPLLTQLNSSLRLKCKRYAKWKLSWLTKFPFKTYSVLSQASWWQAFVEFGYLNQKAHVRNLIISIVNPCGWSLAWTGALKISLFIFRLQSLDLPKCCAVDDMSPAA